MVTETDINHSKSFAYKFLAFLNQCFLSVVFSIKNADFNSLSLSRRVEVDRNDDCYKRTVSEREFITRSWIKW